MRRILVMAFVLCSLSEARALPTLDPTFGTGGVAPLTVLPRIGRTIVLRPDGRIVLAGVVTTTPSTLDLGLNRLLPDGSLDPTFGTAGRVVQDLGASEETPTAVALQPDGKIVVASTLGPPITESGAIARFDADGALDGTFGTGGIVTTAVGSIADMALMADGRIVVAGTVHDPPGPLASSHVWLGRFDGQGVPDPTFGTGGVVHLTRAATDIAASVVVDPGGAVVVGGVTGGPPFAGLTLDFLLERVDAGGTLDPTFGTSGVVRTDFMFGTDDYVRTLLRQADGKLVAVGTALHPIANLNAIAVARYDATGVLDTPFGINGLNLIASPGGQPVTLAAVLDASERIVVGGHANLVSGFVTRIDTGGVLDAGWPFTINQTSSIGALAIQPDHRIVASGASEALRILTGDDCGNGTVDPGESCDDGNTTSGDCCSAVCQLEPNGSTCSDGDPCTVGDACTTGACVPGAPLAVTLPCHQCDSATGLEVPRPRTGCKTTVRPGRAVLKLTDGGRRFTWRWNDGQPTITGELGDPIADPSIVYQVCLFDESGAAPALLNAGTAASNPTPDCAHPPCWRASSDGRLTYRSNPPNASGLTGLQLRPGPAGRPRVRAKGIDLLFGPLALPANLPLRAQVWAGDAGCFEAEFSAAGLRRNDARRFQAKSD